MGKLKPLYPQQVRFVSSVPLFVGYCRWNSSSAVEYLKENHPTHNHMNTLRIDGQLEQSSNNVHFTNQKNNHMADYATLLKWCANTQSMEDGKCVHAHIIKTGFKTGIFMENQLMNLYAKCGFMLYARQLFDRMAERDLVSWNAIIMGYAQNEHAMDALKLFRRMLMEQVTGCMASI
jgi:pentatricopeptide repeat protein